MRRLLLLVALLASLFAPPLADAAGFRDAFLTDPFRFPRRWCMRAHGAAWDGVGAVDVWKDTVTTQRVTNTGCFAYVTTPVGEDAGSTFGRYLMRTALPFGGENKRNIRVRFGLPANFSSTDTLELYAAVHPHCNAGVKATLSSPAGDGDYQLKIDVADSADGSGSTECAYQGGTVVSIPASELFALTADNTNKERYEILFRVNYDNALGKLEGTVKLYDLNVSATTIVPNAKVANKKFTKPVWWGRQANFFAIGGNKSSGAKTPVGLIEVLAK